MSRIFDIYRVKKSGKREKNSVFLVHIRGNKA